jgi:CHAT domain-containing protein/tetratricopeptide (TPR) repeat protein
MTLLLLAAFATLAEAAAPPAQLTPQQSKAWAQRNRLLQQATTLFRDEQIDEAISAIRKALNLERGIFGGVSGNGLTWLERLARLQEEREQLADAIASRRELLTLRRQRHGPDDWRVSDARLALEDSRLLARLSKAQRHRVLQAEAWNNRLVHLWQQGKSKEALPLAQKALAARREILGEEHPLTAQSWFNLAAQYKALGRFPDAIRCGKKALAIRMEKLGKEHPTYAANLNSLATLYQEMGQHRLALPLFQQALKIRREALGEEHPDYAASLNNLAGLYHDRREYRLALPLYRQAVKLHKAILGEKHPDYATSLNNLAALYQDMGEHRLARSLVQQALEIRREVLGEGHPDYAQSLNNLAALHQAAGEPHLALPLYQQALKVRKATLGEKHLDYATSLNNLALVYKDLGEYRLALPLLQQGLQVRKEALGEKHADYAGCLNNLALVYKDLGEHRLALPLFQRALEVCKAVQGEKHPSYAVSLANLALLYHSLGEDRLALPLLQQALKVAREVQGEKHPDYVGALNNLALVHHSLGQHRLALALYRQALEVRKATVGEKHPDYATNLNNLAVLYKDRGEDHLALPLLRQALTISREVQGEKHPSCANNLNNLAMLYIHMGKHSKAFPLLQQAQAIRKEVQGVKHPDYATSLNNLALLCKIVGREGAYLVLAGQSLAATQASVRDSLSVLSDRQRQQLLQQHAHHLEVFLSGAVGTVPAPVLYEQAATFKDVTSATLAEQRLARQQPALRPLLDRLRDVRSQLARLGGQVPPAREVQQWRQRFDDVDRRKIELEQQLARASTAFAQLREKPTATRVGSRLPARTALVEFLSYRHSLRLKARGRWEQERRLLAFVVRPDRETELLELGQADRLFSAVRLWRQSVTADGARGADPDAARLLRQRLWQPITKHLDGIDTVLMAPDGDLASLPFAALPGDKAGTFLLERYTFAYLSSGRQLLLPSAEAKGDGLLVLGGADFGKQRLATNPLQRSRNWSALPGAELEAKQIESVFRSRFKDSRMREMRGKRADRSRFLAALDAQKSEQRWRYLHLATHGHFDAPRDALPPSVLGAWSVGAGAAPGLAGATGSLLAALAAQEPGALNQERGFDPSGRRYRVDEGNPMLLTSLVLAGVNDKGEEGYLSAEEIALQDLSACELAVLSACETAAGRQAGWQGVQGLQRGFHQAGARHVLASLWSVSDPATSLLMEHFYTNLWQKNLPASQALRQAQLFVLKNPESVRQRAKGLLADAGKRGLDVDLLRGVGKKAVALPTVGKPGTPRSPVAWWAPWVLSGAPTR